MPLLTPEFLPGLNAFTHRYFENLFGRLGAGSVLVLDNCQNAPSRSPFFVLLREGLSRLPQGITAILISRTDLPAVFARARANRQVRMLGWKELRLTAEETRGIARFQRRRRIPWEAIREAHRRADGWAAGVTLLLDTEGEGGKETRTPALRPPGEIFDYFGEEVYSRLGKEMKSFLLRSAFLPRMTAGMAQGLTENPRAGEILSYLSRSNFFTEMPDADGDLAHESLSSNLKRLRKRLGEGQSVLLRDGRISLNNRHCWVDAWTFERILGKAGAARKPGAPVPDGREFARIAEQAIALYRGTFLSGETFCPEIVAYRERLRSKFLRTVVQAGRHWELSGKWETAVASYEKGLPPRAARAHPIENTTVPYMLASACVGLGGTENAYEGDDGNGPGSHGGEDRHHRGRRPPCARRCPFPARLHPPPPRKIFGRLQALDLR